MSKNLMGKSISHNDTPYAIFEGISPFGNTTVKLLKSYQKPEKELLNLYAKWMVGVKTDHTFGSYDLGDSYVQDVVRGLALTYASDTFKENYFDTIDVLKKKAGFTVNLKGVRT